MSHEDEVVRQAPDCVESSSSGSTCAGGGGDPQLGDFNEAICAVIACARHTSAIVF